MLKYITLACTALVLNSCCYCIIQVPDLYPIPEEWELEMVEDCDATEVIPGDK
jgi:hypothetical protein